MTNAPVSVFRFLFRPSTENNSRIINVFKLSISCFLIFVSLVSAAPHRSKNRDGPQLMYDQKQTGDYNIRLDLKDFQIIALLGDDSLGDYDYSYDYADFTIKPSGSSSTTTTSKPSSTTSTTRSTSTTARSPTTATTSLISSTTLKPSEIFISENSSINSQSNPSSSALHPYPIEVVVPDPPKKPIDDEKIKTKASKGSNEESGVINKKPEIILNEIISSTLSSILHIFNDTSNASSISSTTASPTLEDNITPDKIKVQILEAPTPTEILAPIPIGIVPGEDVLADPNEGALLGEFSSYRKCASGFSRDKRGRCRRVRRPGVATQLPFAFGRIASNLATKLKLPNQDKVVAAPNSAQN